jgi:hypothetical protein
MDRLRLGGWKHRKSRLYRNNALPIALLSAVVFPIAIISIVLYLIVVEFSTVVVALPPIVVELRFILLALGVAVVSAVVMAFRRRRWFVPGRR